MPEASVQVVHIFIIIEDDPESERGDSARDEKFDYLSLLDADWLQT